MTETEDGVVCNGSARIVGNPDLLAAGAVTVDWSTPGWLPPCRGDVFITGGGVDPTARAVVGFTSGSVDELISVAEDLSLFGSSAAEAVSAVSVGWAGLSAACAVDWPTADTPVGRLTPWRGEAVLIVKGVDSTARVAVGCTAGAAVVDFSPSGSSTAEVVLTARVGCAGLLAACGVGRSKLVRSTPCRGGVLTTGGADPTVVGFTAAAVDERVYVAVVVDLSPSGSSTAEAVSARSVGGWDVLWADILDGFIAESLDVAALTVDCASGVAVDTVDWLAGVVDVTGGSVDETIRWADRVCGIVDSAGVFVVEPSGFADTRWTSGFAGSTPGNPTESVVVKKPELWPPRSWLGSAAANEYKVEQLDF